MLERSPHTSAMSDSRQEMRRSDFRPEVLSYADNLLVQIDQILSRYHVDKLTSYLKLPKEKQYETLWAMEQEEFDLFLKLWEEHEKILHMKELPKSQIEKCTEAIREILGGERAWKEYSVPTLESLGLKGFVGLEGIKRLDALTLEELDALPIVQMYFPAEQSEEDTAKGIVRKRPSWWSNTSRPPTNAHTYLRSIAQELSTLQNSTILLDTATKPTHIIGGTQHYGSTEGTDSSLDPLLSLFQEAFADKGNRFNRTWDNINTKLLPLAEQKIKEAFKAKGLPNIQFKVTLVPHTIDQQFMMSDSPESSLTDTYDWTSTKLLNPDGTEVNRHLSAGNFDNGGVGYVNSFDHSSGAGYVGARLAVVFRRD